MRRGWRRSIRAAGCAAWLLLVAAVASAQQPATTPAVPPAESPTLIDQAKEAALKARDATEKAAKTFAETLQGQSLLIGFTQTAPKLDLHYHSASDAGQATVESYSGDPSLGYLLSFESPSKDSEVKLDDQGVWIGTLGFRFTTTYGTFALRQTLQKNAGGAGGGGEVQGSFFAFALPVMYSIVRNSETWPFAIGWGGGLGKAFVRYEAPLRYSVSGTDYNLHVQSDGYYARNVLFVAMDVRVRNILLRFQSFGMTNGESYARFHGRRVATFTDDLTLNITTLAYVVNF